MRARHSHWLPWYGKLTLLGMLFARPGAAASQDSVAIAERLSSFEGEPLPRFDGWLPEGNAFLSRASAGASEPVPMRVDVESREVQPLLDSTALRDLEVRFRTLTGSQLDLARLTNSLQIMPSGSMLFDGDGDQRFAYDMGELALRRLPSPPSGRVPPTAMTYSPDFQRVAYVRGNDLYFTDQAGAEFRVTSNGSEALRNAIADEMYAEGFGESSAMFWSPSGNRLAYVSFDQSDVARHPMWDHTLPIEVAYQRYSTAGTPTPRAALFVVDVATGEPVEVHTGGRPDDYLLRVTWTTRGDSLAFLRLNRAQNELSLVLADPVSGLARDVLRERSETFLNAPSGVWSSPDGETFLLPSEKTGFRHIYQYRWDGSWSMQLTSGEQTVKRLHGFSPDADYVFYSARLNQGLDQAFFRVNVVTGVSERLTGEAGTHDVILSPNGAFFFERYSNLETAPRNLLRATEGGQIVGEVGPIPAGPMPHPTPPELLSLEAADGQTELNGLLFKPAGYDPYGQHPLVLYVYGGPHGRQVGNEWLARSIPAQLAAVGFMVLVVDNRGTNDRGKDFEDAAHLRLGEVDALDQIHATRQILSTRADIDSERIAVTGASYGGYLTLMSMLRAPDLFKVGVVVAPVSDWRFYDSAYTERYMGTPTTNGSGYDRGSVLEMASKLNGWLLFIHGTADRNVHVENTLAAVHAFQSSQRPVDMYLVPGMGHRPGQEAGEIVLMKVVEYLRAHIAR